MVTKSNKKFDWTKAMVLFFAIMLSVGIAVALYAAKELFGLKIGLTTIAVISLHALPAILYYFRYIRGNTEHWKRNLVFFGLLLAAQIVVGLGTLAFRFINGESLGVAFSYAMLMLLITKLTMVATVIAPPILSFAHKLITLVLGFTFYIIALIQSVIVLLVVLIFTPTITEPITNWLFKTAGVKIRFHGPF